MDPKVKEARTHFSADFLNQIATTLLAAFTLHVVGLAILGRLAK